jgi:hypothetical protein
MRFEKRCAQRGPNPYRPTAINSSLFSFHCTKAL